MKRMFVTEMTIFSLGLALMVFSSGYYWLVIFLFGMGLALGCDYPTAHMVISESIPSKNRGKLVLLYQKEIPLQACMWAIVWAF